MSDYDSNPFADPEAGNPFQDPSVTQVTGAAQQNFTEEFNPFAEQGRTTAAGGKTNPVVPPPQKPQPAQQPAVMRPTEEPPAYSPSAAQQAQGPAVPTNEDLMKRQEELERKAAELQRKEREMAAGTYNARANNWPPLPSWCPVGPCFYQDISVDIPLEFQRTVKMMYYLWMFHSITLILNSIMLIAYFATGIPGTYNGGVGLGLSFLYLAVLPICSFVCWYRPMYKAFRSDSSFNFFVFFFIFFFQFVVHIIQAVGISGWGTCGWINGITAVTQNPGVGAIMLIIAAFFTISAVLSIIFLKKVHSLYRTTGASFEKAQAEFTEGVVANRGVQQAAGQFGAAAAKGAARGAMSGASGNQM
ncbi:secretory carrier-associated membrane protein 1-like isoform X4 [Branchiostoma floridae]|uniref:Secretory carrier-associated membrane protein n=1 Tax=Branchiostoma floridae TaxID=7739 RepID=A0A9J7KNK1_BRAFL|nr:secretory carrier-associated membrane protein 1-like isoform X4 [Branchiostoma floridae]